mgnify:CR=1 FL=1
MKFLSKNIKQIHIKEALEIYNYYISNSFSNFEEKKLSLKSFKSIYKKNILNKLPFIIAIDNHNLIGLAFINKFREKSGYRFTYEHSIYINPEFVNNGYGSIILKKLIVICKKNKNIRNLIAVIGGSENIASIKIHKKNGFKYIGTLTKAGYKKNRWIDSVYMQKRI